MTPRPYRMVARRVAAEETRARIVAASRELISAPGGIGAFTIDAVAARARVARTTVFHQFESKPRLIEAVFDSLAIVRRGVPRLVAALSLDDPAATIEAFVETFADVWEEDRLVIRRLAGLAALDPEFAAVWHAREGRRREGLRQIARRVAATHDGRDRVDVESVTSALYAIVSPEAFEAIAGPEHTYGEARFVVLQLARKALGLDGGEPVTVREARRPRRSRGGGRRAPGKRGS